MEVLCVLDCVRSIASLVMKVPLAPSSPIWQLIVMAGDMLHQVNYKLGWKFFILCVLDCIRSIASLVMTVPLPPSSPIWQLIVMAGDMLHQVPYKLGWKFFAYLTASGQLQVW